jgi:hypothetical protein
VRGVTVVVVVPQLLAELGSVWLPLAQAVFVRVPVVPDPTLTTSVKVALAPTARLPTVQTWVEEL